MRFSKQIIKYNRLQNFIKASFAKDKDDLDNFQGSNMSFQKQRVEIQEKYRNQSAALYDHYVQLRNRPLLTLDNYQIYYTVILQRPPIFIPFKQQHFEYMKTKYQQFKKNKRYYQIPKQLQIDRPEFIFTEYQRVNAENTITHRNTVSKTEVYEYAQNSRYWRYSDPSIEDDKSVQNLGTETVYFITKNKDGQWTFPTRVITEKDKHTEVFTLMAQQLFGGASSPLIYFEKKKPIYARRIETDTLIRGQGIQQMFYKGYSINGVPQYPTQNYEDYAWVPKPLLSKYFSEEYYNETISLLINSY